MVVLVRNEKIRFSSNFRNPPLLMGDERDDVSAGGGVRGVR